MSSAGSGKVSRGSVNQLRGDIAGLHASRKRLAEAAQADRRALERELHDGLQQDLTALVMELQRLDRLIESDPVAARAVIHELSGIAGEAVDHAATLATRIYPSILEGRGFASALRSAAGTAHVTAEVHAPANAGYPPEIVTALYWTWTEALMSAAGGSSTSIDVVEDDGRVTFQIAIGGHHSVDVLGPLRDRIEALGGRASARPSEDGGSVIQGWLPLPR